MPETEIEDGLVIVQSGKITDVGKHGKEEEPRSAEILDANGGYISPGLIDIYVNGANDADVSKVDTDTFSTMSKFFAKYGITSYVGTTITRTPADIVKALQYARGYIKEGKINGSKHLVNTHYDQGNASAIIVGEPTSNVPAIGHKGALYLNVSASGKTAHSSMPELGDNAIYKVARAITKIENFSFHADRDELHGFTVDIRSTNKGLGAVLQQLYGGVPTIILGSGQAEMVHQTDEFRYTAKIEEAVVIYKNINLKYGELYL